MSFNHAHRLGGTLAHSIGAGTKCLGKYQNGCESPYSEAGIDHGRHFRFPDCYSVSVIMSYSGHKPSNFHLFLQ